MKKFLILLWLTVFILINYDFSFAAPVGGYWDWRNPELKNGSWLETFDGGGIGKADNILSAGGGDGQWEISGLELENDWTLRSSGYESHYYYEEYNSYYINGTLVLNADSSNPELWFGPGDTSYSAPIEMHVGSKYYYTDASMEGYLGVSFNFSSQNGLIDGFAVPVHIQFISRTYPNQPWHNIYDDYQEGGTIDIQMSVNEGNPVDPIPIPSAVWLLGSGLIGIMGLRRKFKK